MSASEEREGTMPLESWIHDTEEQLLERRRRIRTVASGLRRNVRTRLVSRSVLAASVGFGVLLERKNGGRQWFLATVLMASRLGSLLATSLSSLRSAQRHAVSTGEPRASRRSQARAG